MPSWRTSTTPNGCDGRAIRGCAGSSRVSSTSGFRRLALAPVEQRNAAHAILLTPDVEVLLIRLRSPATGEFFWVTPGGGLEAGETPEQGLRRELREELGLELKDLGAVVWRL